MARKGKKYQKRHRVTDQAALDAIVTRGKFTPNELKKFLDNSRRSRNSRHAQSPDSKGTRAKHTTDAIKDQG